MSAGLPPVSGSPAPVAYASPGSGSQPDARSLQRFLDNATAGTQLRFRVENDVGRVVVQVVDVQSGEVLRQIPREEALRLAREALETKPKATPDPETPSA